MNTHLGNARLSAKAVVGRGSVGLGVTASRWLARLVDVSLGDGTRSESGIVLAGPLSLGFVPPV